MLKVLKFIFMLFVTNIIFSQDKDKVYVILDDNSFYRILKKEYSATLKIPHYNYKDSWNKEKSKNTNRNNDEIVKVEAIPNKKYYRFYSIKKPIKKSNIDNISTFSIIDVSKENKMVWKKYPYEMIFIEKVDCENYILWHMVSESYE